MNIFSNACVIPTNFAGSIQFKFWFFLILSNTKNAFKLNLDILKEQLSVIEKFESVVKDLRNEAVGNNKNLNYEYYLSEAEKAYKNGEFDSVIFDDFIKSANERAKFLKSNTDLTFSYLQN